MLRFDSKNVNYSAASTTADGENQIAYFSANRNGTARCDVSINIDNLSLYLANLTAFEADFTDFMADVSSIDD